MRLWPNRNKTRPVTKGDQVALDPTVVLFIPPVTKLFGRVS